MFTGLLLRPVTAAFQCRISAIRERGRNLDRFAAFARIVAFQLLLDAVHETRCPAAASITSASGSRSSSRAVAGEEIVLVDRPG